MNLSAFARMIVRRGWVALLCALLGAAVGLAFALLLPTTWTAETRVSVQPARPADLGQNQAIREIMHSYAKDIATFDMAAEAAALLGEDWLAEKGLSADALRWLLYVGTDENVYEIRVEARHADPDVASQVSEKTAIAFEARRDEANRRLDLRDQIFVSRRDQTALGVHSPRRRMLVLGGAAVGLVLGFLLVLLLEYLERAAIRDEEEAAAVLPGVPVVGALPGRSARGQALRQGLRDLGRAMRLGLRRGWPVLAFGLLGAGAALAFSEAQPEVWRARTRIAVEPARGSDWGQTQAIPEIMKGYAEDILTRRMEAIVNAELALDLPPTALLDKLNVAPREADYEIYVDARDPDPDVAAAISRSWAERFISERMQANLELDHRDRILVRPRDRTIPSLYTPRRQANLLAGAVLGALVGAAVVFGLAWSRGRQLSHAEDAERLLGAPLLAPIPAPPGGRRWRS